MKKINIITILLFLISNLLFAIRMDSTIFDQRIDNGGGYKEIIFENVTGKTERYKINVAKGETRSDMSKWVALYPKVISIPPFEKRTLKIYAQAPDGLKDGEYSFNLIVTPLVVPVIREETGKIVGSSSLNFVPIIEMIGYSGDPHFEKNLDLKDIKLELKDGRVVLNAKIENNSFAGLHVGLKFKTSNNVVMDGKWLGRLEKGKKEKLTYELSKNVKKVEDIRKIVIYDATNLVELRTIELN